MESDQLHVPAISFVMASGQAIIRTIDFFDFVYVCRNLLYAFIQLVRASVHFRMLFYTIDGYFDAGHYSTFHTYVLSIPMLTSKRTPWYLRVRVGLAHLPIII